MTWRLIALRFFNFNTDVVVEINKKSEHKLDDGGNFVRTKTV